jgi:hypothetical protein
MYVVISHDRAAASRAEARGAQLRRALAARAESWRSLIQESGWTRHLARAPKVASRDR